MSYETWYILLPSAEVTEKFAQSNIVTKHYKLKPEYMGTLRVKMAASNVPVTLSGHVPVSFLSKFGRVEDGHLVQGTIGSVFWDYSFFSCLKSDGFKAIPDLITSSDWHMRVVVVGRRPRSWSCRQQGHLAAHCSLREDENPKSPATPAVIPTAASEKNKDTERGQSEVVRRKKVETNQPNSISPNKTMNDKKQ